MATVSPRHLATESTQHPRRSQLKIRPMKRGPFDGLHQLPSIRMPKKENSETACERRQTLISLASVGTWKTCNWTESGWAIDPASSRDEARAELSSLLHGVDAAIAYSQPVWEGPTVKPTETCCQRPAGDHPCAWHARALCLIRSMVQQSHV